ncbi:hypothetical protein QYE76_046629 [Lolium multiflorum]|uniref:Uncharacterized protein n=1 Tax=Lolium multiflorum TaxID=4521 RepID=A0AAD8TQB2_LOLMU|nr:hypothetical protein QYE76_046629 [Lolium multiflorum]
MENYSLLMGDISVDEDGGGVDGEAFRGHFPVPAACRNRDSCPPDLGFAMAAAGRFSLVSSNVEPVKEEIDEPESSLDEKEEEIDEPESSLDEKEEESDEQKEEEWISYPCQPSNESNSLSLTLFDCPPCLPKEDECYVPVDSLEIFPMSKTCENNYATVIYDNPCYFDKSYDNALFVPDVEMHVYEKFGVAEVFKGQERRMIYDQEE